MKDIFISEVLAMTIKKKIILAKKQQLIRIISDRIYTAFQRRALKPLDINELKSIGKIYIKK